MSPSQLHCTPLSTATCHSVIRQRTAHGTHAAITNFAGFLSFPTSRQVACRIFEIFRFCFSGRLDSADVIIWQLRFRSKFTCLLPPAGRLGPMRLQHASKALCL